MHPAHDLFLEAIDALMQLVHLSAMTLADYMEAESLTETQFAELIGADQSTVHRLRKKGQVPGRDLMVKIFEITGGKVRADDFFGIAA
jgi:hypothetical protein